MIYIFDLDGTLANIEHRLHYITSDNKDWDSFFKSCEDDKPIHQVIEVLNALQAQGHRIWIFTGRSDIAYQHTVDWIHEHVTVDRFKLKMRKHGDHQPDFKLKQSWLQQLAPTKNSKSLIAGVFEDRKSVCDMWRNNGLLCFQVAEGDF